jgi:hypothetical protein
MHPIIVLVILLTPPLLLTHTIQHLNLNILGIAGLGPPLVYAVSQHALYRNWKRRTILSMPVLFIIGTGIAWTNSRAVLRGFLNRHDEFRRTPKYAQRKESNRYALRLNTSTLWEAALCLYAAWGVWMAYRFAPPLVLYLTIYCVAFGIVALWGLHDTLAVRKAAT